MFQHVFKNKSQETPRHMRHELSCSYIVYPAQKDEYLARQSMQSWPGFWVFSATFGLTAVYSISQMSSSLISVTTLIGNALKNATAK